MRTEALIDGVAEAGVDRRFSRLLLYALAFLAALVPVDFVRVTQPWLYASLMSLSLGAVVSLWLISREKTMIAWPVIAFIFIVLFFNQIMRPNPIGFVTLLAPIIVGIGVGVSARRPLAILVGVLVVSSFTMAIESIESEHIFGALFGTDNYVAFSQDIFRARGLIGQPVPAAMVALALAAGALVLSGNSRRHRGVIRIVIVFSTAVSVLASGTRSAVLCSAFLALLILTLNYFRVRSRGVVFGRNGAWIVPLVAAGGLSLLFSVWSALSGQRVFSFGSLSGSASLDNRNYASLVFNEWSENCHGACLVFGSGARSLLETLSQGLGFRGFTTVDNLFLSLLWDFGVVSIFGIVSLTVVALHILARSHDISKRAGAIIVISILVSGFFYDALYIRPVLLLFGVGIGLMSVKLPAYGEVRDVV